MQWLFVAVLAGAAGLLVGLAAGWMARTRVPQARPKTLASAHDPNGLHRLDTARDIPDAGVGEVLAVLGDIAIVVDSSDAVVRHGHGAVPLGLVRDSDLVPAALRDVVRRVRRDGVIREAEVDVPRGPIGEGLLHLDVRAAPLGAGHVLLLIEDRTQERRVEEVRRDFVANVSHELKTPVGGISLLAEAILDAADDRDAVARFAGRIGTESARLSALVAEIVELSRLQTQEGGRRVSLVDVSLVTHEAIEATRTLAEGRGITFVAALEPHTCVYGDPTQLRTAVANLLTNAVNYSAPKTRVAISARTRGFVIEVAVADQGCGIAPADQQRIFERFYRVDAARSRSTGGTGLGLAIVKHICANHGGDVTVWSSEGHGSTFTMRLPTASHGPVPDHSHEGGESSGTEPPPRTPEDAPPRNRAT